ncbi:hypothetical protein BC940DRAFT_315355 [Gongronella butleri]|nr:hypothetical protein BC940DRAFT_315355 [Gongronella butleri]
MSPCKSGNYLILPIFLEDGTKVSPGVHRLIYSTFIGELLPNHDIDHIDHNPENYHKDNLRQLQAEVNRKRRRSPSPGPSTRPKRKVIHSKAHPLEKSASVWLPIGLKPDMDFSEYEISVFSNARKIGETKLLSRHQIYDKPYLAYTLKNVMTGTMTAVSIHQLMSATFNLPIGLGWPRSFTSALTPSMTASSPTLPVDADGSSILVAQPQTQYSDLAAIYLCFMPTYDFLFINRELGSCILTLISC